MNTTANINSFTKRHTMIKSDRRSETPFSSTCILQIYITYINIKLLNF